MKSSPKTVHIAEPLWRALEAMSEQMGVDTDALLNQAVYTLARLNGFVQPPQIKPTDETAAALEPISVGPALGAAKPGPPVPTPPRPPVAATPATALPAPPVMELPPPVMQLPPPAPAAPAAPAPPAPARPEGPSEADRAELRAKAVEQMKSIAEEVERIVNVRPDAPMVEDGEEDEDEDEEVGDEEEGEEDEAEASAGDDEGEGAREDGDDEAGDDEAGDGDDERGEADDGEEPEGEEEAAAEKDGSIEDDLEALGMGQPARPEPDDDDGSDLSPLPTDEEEDESEPEPDAVATTQLRPKLRPEGAPPPETDDQLGIPTAGVRVDAVPEGRRPDGAEEINVTGTVRRLAVKLPKEEAEEEPQERTQIVRHERARLYVTRGGADPVEVVSERYLIGRGPHCDLVIESNRVSREHAAVFAAEEGFVVEDLGSSNGTWFKQERVEKHVIADGDEVFFGNEPVRFTVKAPPGKRGTRRDGRAQA